MVLSEMTLLPGARPKILEELQRRDRGYNPSVPLKTESSAYTQLVMCFNKTRLRLHVLDHSEAVPAVRL